MAIHRISISETPDLRSEKRFWSDCDQFAYPWLLGRLVQLVVGELMAGRLRTGNYSAGLNGGEIHAYADSHHDRTEVVITGVDFGDGEGPNPDGGIPNVALTANDRYAAYSLSKDGRQWSLAQTQGEKIPLPVFQPISRGYHSPAIKRKRLSTRANRKAKIAVIFSRTNREKIIAHAHQQLDCNPNSQLFANHDATAKIIVPHKMEQQLI